MNTFQFYADFLSETKKDDMLTDTIKWEELISTNYKRWRRSDLKRIDNICSRYDRQSLMLLKDFINQSFYNAPGAKEMMLQIDDILNGKYGSNNLEGDWGIIASFWECVFAIFQPIR